MPCTASVGPLTMTAVPAGPQSWSQLDPWPCPEVAGLEPAPGAGQCAWPRISPTLVGITPILTLPPRHT